MDDWQKDWPQSEGLRFRIEGKTYDVYFPVAWSGLRPSLKNPLANKMEVSGHDYYDYDKSLTARIVSHPDGFFYQKSKKEIVPDEFLISGRRKKILVSEPEYANIGPFGQS